MQTIFNQMRKVFRFFLAIGFLPLAILFEESPSAADQSLTVGGHEIVGDGKQIRIENGILLEPSSSRSKPGAVPRANQSLGLNGHDIFERLCRRRPGTTTLSGPNQGSTVDLSRFETSKDSATPNAAAADPCGLNEKLEGWKERRKDFRLQLGKICQNPPGTRQNQTGGWIVPPAQVEEGVLIPAGTCVLGDVTIKAGSQVQTGVVIFGTGKEQLEIGPQTGVLNLIQGTFLIGNGIVDSKTQLEGGPYLIVGSIREPNSKMTAADVFSSAPSQNSQHLLNRNASPASPASDSKVIDLNRPESAR